MKNENEINVLEIESLEKAFEGNIILQDINFTLGEGQKVAIIGSSGIGKTTLINILSKVDANFSGRISNKANKTSVLFQEDRLLPWLNVYKNIKIVNKTGSDEFLRELLTIMELSDYSGFYPNELSGGMRERVALARAIYYDAELIILDEPLKSTDAVLASKVTDYIKEHLLESGKSLILITHNIETAFSLCDKILFLSGSPAFFIDEVAINEHSRDEVMSKFGKYIARD